MRGCHDAEMACLAVSCAQLACSCVVLIVFARFLQKVVRQAEFFSRSQTKRLLIIACLNLLEVVFGLLLPTIGGANEGALEQLVAIQPTLDLRLLSFSLMFFALAGVFEYGRILQEDSDSIL